MTESLYVLDTDTCIYWLKGDPQIEKAILAAGLGQVAVTVITECELFYGAYKSARTKRNLETLRSLRRSVRTIHTSCEVAPVYGEIKASLEKLGQPLDDADLLIAALAMASNGVLVTNNTRHFKRVPGLLTENWREQTTPATR